MCPCKEKDMWRHRHTQTEDRNLKKKAESGMMQLQMKGHNGLQDNTEARREARRDWSLDPLKAHAYSGTLNSDF